jgi:site-specific recombinase XerD
MKGARPLEKDEVQTLIGACQDLRERTLVILGLNMGLRISELLGLRWGDLIQRGRVLPLVYLERTRTKSQRARAIPVNSRAAEAIGAWLAEVQGQGAGIRPQDPVFQGRGGQHLCRSQGHRLLVEIFNRAQLSGRVSSHTLRKTFATLLLDQGISLPVIGELLGHANVATTQRYLGVGMGSLKEAVQGLVRAY